MTVSPISSSMSTQAELHAPAKAPVPSPSPSPSVAGPTDTVLLSSAAKKPAGGDVDHDGDGH
jgi:hypothetical protein